MAFNNPAMPWKELERRLSDGRAPGSPSWNAGGDGPAWGRKRQPFEPTLERRAGSVPYAELHCHSNYSFLDGASHPEELATVAARLGLEALALTDHDGLYGIARFAEAARAVKLPTVFGAEFTIDPHAVPQNGQPDPHGAHLVVLADGPGGYAQLARAISLAQLAGEKGAPRTTLAELADSAGASPSWWVLTGCRKGAVPAALVSEGPTAARRELARLVEAFGRERVAVELWDHGDPLDAARNDALAELAARADIACIATNNVHYAVPARRALATALAAVRARRVGEVLDRLRAAVEQRGRTMSLGTGRLVARFRRHRRAGR